MSKTKRTADKALYMAEAVADEVRRVSNIIDRKLNPVDIPSLGIKDFMPMLRDLDVQQACGRYVWEGLPPEIASWQIENMLYHRGYLAGTIYAGQLYVLPYAQTQGVNIMGMPVAGHLITYNGASPSNNDQEVKKMFNAKEFYFVGSGSQTIVVVDGKKHKADAAILCDRIPFWTPTQSIYSPAVLVSKLLECQCDLLARVAINVKNSNVKLVFSAQDPQAAEVLKRDLTAVYGSEYPFIVVARESMESVKNEIFQTKVELETQALFETWQSYNSLRCMMRGIENNGTFEKKERKITGELESSVQTNIVLENGLAMRKLWLAQMRLIFPDYDDLLGSLTVRINDAFRESVQNGEETNGNEENDGNEAEDQ